MVTPDVRQSMLDEVAPSSIERTDALPDPLLGARLGHYEISFVLGKGAYGAVYKARDVTLGRSVAIKFLHPFLDKTHHRMFLEEAKAVAALGKHPAIVTIFEFSEYHGRKYFVLEFVGSHAGMLLRVHPRGLPLELALRIGKECADGLHYAHKNNIIHRDIKPANILLEIEGGSAKLADFGVAKLFDPAASTQGGAPGGTPAYMAPEIIGGFSGDARSDVFSLGVTLYELLSGTLPYTGNTPEEVMARITANQRKPIGDVRELPASIAAVVEKAMAHRAEDRYQTAADVAMALATCMTPAVPSSAAPDTVTQDEMRLVKLKAFQMAQDAKRNGGDRLAQKPMADGIDAFRNGEAYEQLKQFTPASKSFEDAARYFKETIERAKAIMERMLTLKSARTRMEGIRGKAESAHAPRLAADVFVRATAEETLARETSGIIKATQLYDQAAKSYFESLKLALKHGEAELVAPRDEIAAARKQIESLGIGRFVKGEIAQASSLMQRAQAALPDFTAAKGYYGEALSVLQKGIAAGAERKRLEAEMEARDPVVVGGIELVWIPPGTFYMGSDDASVDEEPKHEVTIPRGFWTGKYPVTQEQWTAIMGNNPSGFTGSERLPVEKVSWFDCQAFTQKLTALGKGRFRLPSEAEWEYACRAGEPGDWCFGSDSEQLNDYAWNHEIANGRTHPVGEKKPNAWGLYDMHGNVCEWCEDHRHPDYAGAPEKGQPWLDETTEERMTRGGSWCIITPECRSAYRGWFASPDTTADFMGLRVCMSD